MAENRSAGLLLTAKWCGWVALGSSIPLVVLSWYGIGPDWTPLISIFLLIVGILWLVKAVPAFRRQFELEEGANKREESLKGNRPAAGDERMMRTASLRLEPESSRSVWLSEDNQVLGSVFGTHELGRIWATAMDSDERLLLKLRCANPAAWYRYGYKRRLRWFVTEPDDARTIGVIELRPTFLGRFRWPIVTEKDHEFGQVKAGVEWSRIPVGLAGAVPAAVIPNLEHHATVFMHSCPVCAVSWSGRSAALTFLDGEWDLAERKLAIGAAMLLSCCPNYYRHA